MKCPICNSELRRSKKDPTYGLCDNCRKKFKWVDDEDFYEDYEEATPANPTQDNMISCPKCRSTNVNVQMMQVGGKTKKHGNGIGGHLNNAARGTTALFTLGMSNILWKKSEGNEKMTFKNETVCLCQNCGNSWNV